MANKQQVIDLHRKQPDWSSGQIAEKLGCMPEYVRSTFKRNGLTLAKNAGLRGELYDLGRACKAAGLTLADIQDIKSAMEN